MRPSALFASAALLCASRIALAQSVGPSLDLRGFRAPTDPASGIYLQPADAPATGDWNASLWMSYAFRPIALRDAKTKAVSFNVISHQVTSDVAASVGIAHRVVLGFDMPVLLYQRGDTPDARARSLLGDAPLPAQALGDLGLDAKLTLIRPTGQEFGGFALALHERFTVPTGNQASYLGEGAVTSETRVLAEYRLVAIGVYVAAGLKLRGQQERFACAPVEQDESCPSRFGHELPLGLGVAIKPQILGFDQDGHLTLYLESHGHVPLSPISPFDSAAVSSLQGSLGARYTFRDVSLLAGIQTTLSSGIGDSPFRAVLAVGWAPRNHDADGDSIDDDLDQCRDLPEDKDGFEDDDGCPDADNDSDGVPDKADKCPLVKEDEDGFQDDDGCPDADNDGDGIRDADDKCPNEKGAREALGCPAAAPESREGDKPPAHHPATETQAPAPAMSSPPGKAAP